MFDRRLYIDISSATEEMKEAIVRAAAEKGYNFPSGRDVGRIPSYADYIYLRPHTKMITYSRDLVGRRQYRLGEAVVLTLKRNGDWNVQPLSEWRPFR